MHSSCMHVCMYVSCYDHRLQGMTRSTSFKGLLTSRFIQMIYLSRLVRHCVHYGASVYKINRLVVIKIPDRYETFGGGLGMVPYPGKLIFGMPFQFTITLIAYRCILLKIPSVCIALLQNET